MKKMNIKVNTVKPKEIAKRTFGLALMSFPAGMGVGSIVTGSWFTGGLVAFGTAAVTVSTYIGVMIAWNGDVSIKDIQEAFRTATSKAGEDNEVIAEVLDKDVK
jgi:hypothetical protein